MIVYFKKQLDKQNAVRELSNNMNVTSDANTVVAISNGIADFEEVIPYTVMPNSNLNINNLSPLSQSYLYTEDEVISLCKYIYTEPENTIVADDEIILHTKIPSNIGMIRNAQNDGNFFNNEEDFDGDEIVLHTQIPSGSNMIDNRAIWSDISNSSVFKVIANNMSNHNVSEVDVFRKEGIDSRISRDVTEEEVDYNEKTNGTEIDQFIARHKEIDSQLLERNSIELDFNEYISTDRELRNCRSISGKAIPNFEESLRTKKEHLVEKLREASKATSNLQPRSYGGNSNRTMREKMCDKLRRKQKCDSNKFKVNDQMSWMRQCKKRKNIWAGLGTPLRVPKHATITKQDALQTTDPKNIAILQSEQRNYSEYTNTQMKSDITVEGCFEEEYNFGCDKFQ